MFRDETCLDRFAAMLVGASIAGAAVAGVPVPPGVAETLAAGASLLVRLRGQRRTDAERVLKSLQCDLKAQWRAWGARSPQIDRNLFESAVASFEDVIPYCAPIPTEVVGAQLDPDAIADRVLAKAVRYLPEVYADDDPRNDEAHLARAFLLNVTRAAYASLMKEPEYIHTLAPALWRDLFGQLNRMEATDARIEQMVGRVEDRLDSVSQSQYEDARQEGVRNAMADITTLVGLLNSLNIKPRELIDVVVCINGNGLGVLDAIKLLKRG